LLGVTKCEQARFAGFAGVAHEEFAERSITEHDDDAIFVHVVAGIGEQRHRWHTYVERQAVSGDPPHPATSVHNRHAMHPAAFVLRSPWQTDSRNDGVQSSKG